MKINLVEELSRMKNLFGYERGRVVSEQKIILEANGMTKAEYPQCIQAFGDPKIDPQGKKYAIFGTDSYENYWFYPDGSVQNYAIGGHAYGSLPEDKIVSNIVNSYVCKDGQISIIPQGETTKTEPQTQPKKDEYQTLPNVTIYPIPKFLGDVEGVKKFQTWLDTNHSGWLGKTGSKLGKGKGFGRFGPKTNKAWKSYGEEYKKSLGGDEIDKFISDRYSKQSTGTTQTNTTGQVKTPITAHQSKKDYNPQDENPPQ